MNALLEGEHSDLRHFCVAFLHVMRLWL